MLQKSKYGFSIILTIVVIAVLSIGAGLYIGTDKNKKPDRATSTDNLKIYNEKYGFSFEYPKGLAQAEQYPDGEDCRQTEIDKDYYVNSVTVAQISNLAIHVVCAPLTKEAAAYSISYGRDPEQTEISTPTIAGKTAYQRQFVNATGYYWRIIQIPLDTSYYVELAYTFGNSHRLNNNGYELSDKEW